MMVEYALAAMVLLVCLMAARISGLKSELKLCVESNTTLSEQVDVLTCRCTEMTSRSAKANRETHEMLAAIAKYLGFEYPISLPTMYWDDIANPDDFRREYWGNIHTSIENIRKQASAGNRDELVCQLVTMCLELGFSSSNVDEFMLELTTLPKAAANRLHLHILRGSL